MIWLDRLPGKSEGSKIICVCSIAPLAEFVAKVRRMQVDLELR